LRQLKLIFTSLRSSAKYCDHDVYVYRLSHANDHIQTSQSCLSILPVALISDDSAKVTHFQSRGWRHVLT